jgi:hypothetical protein
MDYEMDPKVQEYLAQKLAERQAIQKEYDDQTSGLGMGQFAAGMGAALAGRSPDAVNQQFEGIRGRIKADTLGAFDSKEKMRSEANKEILENYYKRKKLELEEKKMEQSDSDKGLDRALKERALEQSLSDKALKKQELSLSQAKQLGLAEMGNLANKQYEDAVKKGFEPTSYGSLVDQTSWAPQFLKSDAGKEAAAAQEAWVETYLRDASGAAIPVDERFNYSKPFFPQRGDSPKVIENKAALRAQKEKIALLGAGKGAEQFEKASDQKPQSETKTYQGKTYQYVGGDRSNPESWKVVGQ